MFTMQAFHNWLSSTTETPNTYRHSLAKLTQISRKQVANIASDLTWYIWG
jgi:hypothetical protein